MKTVQRMVYLKPWGPSEEEIFSTVVLNVRIRSNTEVVGSKGWNLMEVIPAFGEVRDQSDAGQRSCKYHFRMPVEEFGRSPWDDEPPHPVVLCSFRGTVNLFLRLQFRGTGHNPSPETGKAPYEGHFSDWDIALIVLKPLKEDQSFTILDCAFEEESKPWRTHTERWAPLAIGQKTEVPCFKAATSPGLPPRLSKGWFLTCTADVKKEDCDTVTITVFDVRRIERD
ncbi:hypothetical protein OQA88_1136 [Cercophora sp. LCS_1]